MRPGSINGIGTTFRGIGPIAPDRSRTATLWWTFLYLPIVPVKRLVIRPIALSSDELGEKSIMQFETLDGTFLDWSEVGRTYLWGWLIGPVFIGAPFALFLLSDAIFPDTLPNAVVALPLGWAVLAAIFLHFRLSRQLDP